MRFKIKLYYNGTSEIDSYILNWRITEKEYKNRERIFSYLNILASTGDEVSPDMIDIEFDCKDTNISRLNQINQDIFSLRKELSDRLSKAL